MNIGRLLVWLYYAFMGSKDLNIGPVLKWYLLTPFKYLFSIQMPFKLGTIQQSECL